MAAQFLPTKRGARLPDIAGSVLRGVQLGLQARQLKVQEGLAKDRYALALKTEKRLNDESIARTAQITQGIAFQQDQQAREKELQPLRVREGTARVAKAEQEASPLERGLRLTKGAIDIKAINARINESKSKIKYYDEKATREVAEISRTTSRNNLKDAVDVLESWSKMSPGQRVNLQAITSRSTNPVLKSALENLDPNATSPIDLSTEGKMQSFLFNSLMKSGNTKEAALVLSAKASTVLTGLPSTDVEKALTDFNDKINNVLKKFSRKPEQVKTRAREELVKNPTATLVNIAAIELGWSKVDSNLLLDNTEAMKLFNDIMKSAKDRREAKKLLKEAIKLVPKP